MRKRRFRVFCGLALAFLLFASPLLAQNYIEASKKGIIDWTNGVIEAVGSGFPPKDPANVAQARAAAKTAAVMAARENLREILTGIRVDSGTLIKDLVARTDHIRAAAQAFLQQAQIVSVSYLPDGSVEATVAMKLTPSFAEMILPESIQAIHPIQQPGSSGQEKGEVYTGLVLDCRGLKVSPSMVLRIVDEDGNEVYGSSYVSREFAVRQGMAGYTKGLNAAQCSQRVGKSPLTVRGIRTAKSGSSDVVISNADAERIRRAASNLSFLQKSRVMIVLD